MLCHLEFALLQQALLHQARGKFQKEAKTIAAFRGVRNHDFKKRVLLNMSLALLASDIGANAAIKKRTRICIEHKPHFTFHMRVRMERAVIQVWMHLHREVLSSVENLQKQRKSSGFKPP